MKTHFWTFSGLALALLGPGCIALLWKRTTAEDVSVASSVPWLFAFAALVASVATIAFFGERLGLVEIGFGRMSWISIPSAIALALLFILVFGPLASWALARSGLGGFDAGMNRLAALPAWYLGLTIIVVASGEEWLYRGYAIERLAALTGDHWIAASLSLLAFGLVHLPLWELGVSLTTLASGAILTALYLWRRDVSFLILAHVLTDLYGILIAPRSEA